MPVFIFDNLAVKGFEFWHCIIMYSQICRTCSVCEISFNTKRYTYINEKCGYVFILLVNLLTLNFLCNGISNVLPVVSRFLKEP